MSSSRRKRSIFDLINQYAEQMEELAEELLPLQHPSWDIEAHTIEPLCNVFITPEKVIVTADLPFSDPKSIKINPVDEKTLEINAKMKRRMCCEDFGIIHQKGEFFTFNCQTRIPVPVNMERREVKFKKGILEVKLPRKKGFRIEVE